MLGGGVARRYAQALFELAAEAGLVDKYEQELQELAEGISGNSEISEFLNNPRISTTNKKELLNKAFTNRYSAQVQNFVNMLVDRQRYGYLLEIFTEFRSLADQARNAIEAQVKSAVPLSEEQKDKLLANLSKATGKTVRLVAQVDPSLIGGAVVKIGDRVVDGSVAGRLARLKETLVQN